MFWTVHPVELLLCNSLSRDTKLGCTNSTKGVWDRSTKGVWDSTHKELDDIEDYKWGTISECRR